MKMKNIFALRLIIVILSVCAVAVSALLMISDPQNHIVWIICSLCIASVVALLVEAVISSKNLRKYITQMDKEIALTERESLYNFPAPAIIIDDENVIVWYNRLYEDQVPQREAILKELLGHTPFDVIIGALLGFWIGDIGILGLALSLGFASGAMLYVVFGEILPQAILMYHSKLPAFSAIVGILVGLLIIF